MKNKFRSFLSRISHISRLILPAAATVLACCSGCSSFKSSVAGIDKSFVIQDEVDGAFFHAAASSPTGNGLPNLTAGLGKHVTLIAPTYASSNGVMKVETPQYSSGAAANQNGSSSAIAQQGNTWIVLGHVTVLYQTNVISAPASNLDYSKPDNNTPK